MRCILVASSIAMVLELAASSHAAPFYANDFEVDDSANWTTNKGPATTDEAHNFFFDYSTVGIPLAPNSAPGGTRGLKLQANQSSAVFGGMSASPTGLNLTGSVVKLTFDWWANFNGPAPVGSSGSTQLSTFGVGTSGTVAQWPGGTQDSIWFAATTDGNSANDWRAYSPAPDGAVSYLPMSGVYAAGMDTSPDARNHLHPYYSGFGGVSAPAAQLALYPQQTGVTLVGSAAYEWHEVVILKTATSVTWTVDGTLIATVPAGDDTVLTGNNIFFGHSDTNLTSSTDPQDVNLLFTLIDNVRVVPEPSSLVLSLMLALGACVAGRRR